jgi:drug/metabolite transporter (DMT)-like permease
MHEPLRPITPVSTTVLTPRRDLLSGVLLGLFAVIAWGAYSVAARHGLDGGLTAWDLTALRFITAGVVMAPFLWRLGLRDLGGVGWGRGIALTIGAGPLFAWLYAEGLRNTPFAHGPVIAPSTITLASLVLSAVLLGEKVSWLRWLGVAVVIAGLVFVADSRADGQGFGLPSAWDGMLFVAGILWAVFTVNLRRWKVDAVRATAIVAVLGLVAVTPLYLATGGLRTVVEHPQAVALQAAFQGLVSAVLATLAYSAAVTRLGASRAGIFPSLVPAVAVLMAIPALGIVPTGLQVTGIVLATAGLILAIGLLDRHRG